MAAVCGYSETDIKFFSVAGAIGVAAGSGATWLVSSATAPLAGGVLGGLAHLVNVLALGAIGDLKCIKENWLAFFIAVEFCMPVVLSFTATALGFPVSIPLALLIGAINVGSIFAGMACFSN